MTSILHLLSGRLLIGICLLLALSACVERNLVASWYVVPAPLDEAGNAKGPATLYVALLNRGPKAAQLTSVSLGGVGGENLLARVPGVKPDGYSLPPQQLVILNTGQPPPNCGPLIWMPLGVYVRIGKTRRPRLVRVERPMPSSLPEEWLKPCPPGR